MKLEAGEQFSARSGHALQTSEHEIGLGLTVLCSYEASRGVTRSTEVPDGNKTNMIFIKPPAIHLRQSLQLDRTNWHSKPYSNVNKCLQSAKVEVKLRNVGALPSSSLSVVVFRSLRIVNLAHL
jgi:hypothetical protein